MNRCVPDWDAAGREMDVIWEPTNLLLPSKGKWDSGHARKSDLGFVPDYDFEELCWEDGQLLVVMQGLNGTGCKNRSCCQSSIGDMAPLTSGDEELLSWLQHPPEDQVDKLAVPSDAVSHNTSVVNGEVMLPNDLTHYNMRRSRASGEGLGKRCISKNVRNETIATFPTHTASKSDLDNNHEISQQIQSSTVAACSSISTACMTSKELCGPGSVATRLSMPTPETHLAVARSSPMLNASSIALNFSNFARPALTFKENLHSLGMGNGPSGAERLKQLDKVTVGASKLRSTDSTTKHLRPIAPGTRGVAPTASTILQSIGGSDVHNSGLTVSLVRGSEQDASGVGAEVNCSANRVQKGGLVSSLISSRMIGLEGSTEVLEATELSDSSSSGGSEDSSDIGGRRSPSMGKRKYSEEDLEIQSKALENEAAGGKHRMAGGNSSKKSRAAENHNQSERRRRNRISEKMKSLQALVPNSYKTEKASMLEEAISYIKALKTQIQMMSSRSGMYFSPVLMQQGMQSVQIAAWPQMGLGLGMGMNMGMGMCAGMSMFDTSMAMAAAAPRQFLQMLPVPGAMPPIQTGASAALDSAHLVRGVVSHVVTNPALHIMMHGRQGVPYVGTHDPSPAINALSPKIISTSQQQPVQGSNCPIGWMGRKS